MKVDVYYNKNDVWKAILFVLFIHVTMKKQMCGIK